MKKIKLFRLLALFVVLIASINNVWAGTRTVYLECARLNWAEANANLYINNADNLTGAVLFSLVDGESSVYSAEVSDTWTNTTVYFFRYKSDNSEQWASFSATLSATKNCGVPYYGNSSWSNGYMGYYFPTATKLYISAYQTYNGGSSASDFATANARLWVYYYLSNGNGGAVKDGHVEATYIESVDSYNTYYYEVPKGIWDAVVLVRTKPSTDFCWSGDNYWGKSIDLDGIELGKNRNHNDTWSAYAPSLSSVALAPATAYSGGGTDDNPYLVSPSATVRVNATPTNPGSLSDGNLTVKYTYKDASNTQLKGQSTDDYYQFTASSVNGTTYSVKVEANNYYGATAGATARTSSILYFQVSATPAVALSVSTAGPVASGTELTLTATPSNTTVTPTYSYYYSTNSGSTYSPIAGTDETPVTSTTQTFTPAVNSPGTYQFKVIMHHNSTDYPCTVFPTTDVQQRRTMAVKNKYTDLYGVETIVNASTASVTGIYNTLSATRDAAPDGYAFAGWEKTSNLSFVSGDATSSSTTVTMSASADDQTLTALYTAKKRIYFDNKMTNWSGTIYVYFFDNSSGWYNTYNKELDRGPGLVPLHSAHHHEMTHIENTSIWYYEYDGTGYTPTQYVAFTKGCMDGWHYVKNGSYAYLEDFNECLPMYMASSTWQEYNYSGNHKYGYWKRYNTTNSGYKLIGLYDGNSDKDYWDIGADEVEFKSTTPNSNTFKATIHLNNATWNFKVSRCAGARLGNTGTMTPTNHSGWEMTPIATDCHIEIPSGGDYEFTINLGSDHIYLSVEYPLLANDYRLLHTGYLHTTDDANHAHPTQSIRHLMKADTTIYDTVSLFFDADHKGTLQLQKCDNPAANDGKGSWTDTASTISLTGVSETGIYSFVITQSTDEDGVRTTSVAPLAENFKYTGDLYIRTDGADGGWEAYETVANNKLVYSDYAKANSGYDYYFCHWIETGKNLHATIANDYSPCITDTVKTGASPFNFESLPSQANVRFMYNSATNNITRAYLSGSSNIRDRFLVLEGDTKMFDKDGNPLTSPNQYYRVNDDMTITRLDEENHVVFDDDHNWIYETTVQAKPGAQVKLTAKYNGNVQYFYGDDGTDHEDSVLLIGGSGTDKYKMRVVYDFKTNRLIKAFVPEGTISAELTIETDMMIVREHQGEAQQITFGASGTLSKVKTVYGAMKFNKWTVNNKAKTGEHDALSLSQYERDLFWISFPFDVNLSDAFGLGTYGTHWIIEYYDGKGRAKNGYWVDSEPNWKFVTPSMRDTFKLKAFEGYILALDLDQLGESSPVWENDVDSAYIYFPSALNVDSITKKDTTIRIDQTGYECTINRQQPNEAYNVNKNRTIADSYWHCIGVPSFANKAHDINDDWSISEGDPSEVDAGDYPSIQSWGTGDLLFVYRWNSSDNSLVPEDATSFTFNAMHSYMVQYNGNTITWSTVTTPVKSIAARQMDIPDLNFCLQLLKDSVRQDQTFVRFTDKAGVTSGFEFNYDMSKEYNGNRGNIWTLTTNGVQVAGNSMPHPLATTIVPVGVKIATSGEYTFTMPEGTNQENVYLIDNVTGSRTNLGLMPYTVTLTTGTIDGRFSLEFPVQNVVTDIDEMSTVNSQLSTDSVRKVFVGGRLYIIRDGKAYDATGAQVK